MTIWRGAGGGGDATTDSEINLITSLANSIIADTATTTAAAASATASELAAQASEDAAAISETNAAASAAAALVSEGAASVSAAAALVSENNAAASALSVNDTNLVHIAGTETITGTKTFSNTIVGSVNGNAATATTSSACSGNAETVTNGVYTSGDQTIGGNKTFSNTILGSISGTTGTFTGNVQMASANGGQLAGLRNRIINGDMRVAQRGTTGTASGGRSYSLDRWQVGYGGTAPTWAQTSAAIAGVTQLTNFLQVTGTAATSVYMMQRIEASNSRDMAGQTVTLSWYAYQTTGSTMSVTSLMTYATATDNFTSVTTIGTSAATSVPTATMTLVTAQFTIPSAATTGLSISLYANQPSLSGGATINASQVQVEVGPVATPFEQRPYGMELALCQRFFERAFMYPSTGTNPTGQLFEATSTSTCYGRIPLQAQKRVIPTVTTFGTAMTMQQGVGVTAAIGTFTGLDVYGGVILSAATTFTSTGINHLVGTVNSSAIDFSAEL